MKNFIIILFLLPLITFGQLDYENPPWDIGCDSLNTQTEMNICSYKASQIADSILLKLLDDNLKYYTSSAYSEKVLELFHKSQSAFIEYRKSLVDFESSKWEGGSIRPLMCNMVHLSATVSRIKELEALLEDNLNK